MQVIPTKSLESLAPRLVGWDGKLLLKNGVIDNQALESYLSEDELLDEEEEADVSILPQEVQPQLVTTLLTEASNEMHSSILLSVFFF